MPTRVRPGGNGMLHSVLADGAETDEYGVLGTPRPAEHEQIEE